MDVLEFLAGLALVIVLFLLFSLPGALLLMVLWNWIVPVTFGLSSIAFWQAWGMYLLSGIIFKSANYQKQ